MAQYFPKSATSSGLDLFSLLGKRRSISAFRTDLVPSEKIDAIISAGEHAPSGTHRHPWLFRIITDAAVKQVIRDKCEIADKNRHKKEDKRFQCWLKADHITPEKRFLTDAPALIAVFGNTKEPYWQESVWICIGYMMLAAIDQGLGTVTYTPGNTEFMNKILAVPEHYIPQAILPIGYPLIEPQSSPEKLTEMEFQTLRKDKNTVSEKKQVIAPSRTNAQQSNVYSSRNTCACGCGKQIVSLNQRRKFIHGHTKFGVNGLHKVLKSPPMCRCGCGMQTDWDWEKMTWKKYIDSHIGLRNAQTRKSSRKNQQFDLFK